MVTVALSSLSPIVFYYGLDPNLTLNSRMVYFNDCLTFFHADIYDYCLDVVLNKDDMLFLSDNIKLRNVVEVTGDDTLYLEDYIGLSTISLSGGEFWSSNLGVFGSQDQFLIQTADLFYIAFTQSTLVSAIDTDDPIVYFIEFDDSLVVIHDSFGQYLTVDPYTFNVSFSAHIDPDVDNYQHFTYVLDGSNIMLSTRIDMLGNSQRTLYFDTAAGVLSAGPTVSDSFPITTNHVFTLGSFVESGLNDIYATQHNWVAYVRDSQCLDVATNKSIQDTEHNFLVSTPFKTLSASRLDVNVNNLKNYQTPEYSYILDGESPYGRSYDRIIAGVNQDEGYENIFLAFNAATHELKLEKDTYTYFHFAPTAATHALSASTLVTDGAVAGKSPYRSDKIFKKQADYKKYSNWGDASIQNGTWFCSWLSGNSDPDVQPVWMDRYFDAEYASLSATALQTALLSAIDNNLVSDIGNPLIWDTPTSMTFEAGCLYIYHHVGESRNDEVVANILNNAGLVLEYSTWGTEESVALVDTSASGYNGSIIGFSLTANQVELNNITDKAYNINGTYGYVEKIDSIFTNDELTFAFNVYADDWENIVGNQILGNHYNGGIGLFNNNPILTPHITLHDPANGYVFHLNTAFEVLNKSVFVPHLDSRAIRIVKTSADENYYILDDEQNILVYDIENILQNVISLTSLVSSISAGQLEVDDDYNFHLLDKIAAVYYKVGTTGALLSSVSLSSGGDYFALDYNGDPRFPLVNGVLAAAINSTDDFYYNTDTYLYRNDNIIWEASDLETMLCDADDNIWLLYGQNKLAKLDSNNKLQFAVVTPVSSVAVGTRSLSYYKELTPTGVEDFVLIFDSRTQCAFKVDTSGAFTSTTPVSSFTNSLVSLTALSLLGVSDNGFEFQRKYVLPELITPGLSVRAFLQEQYINGTSQHLRLQTSTVGFQGTKHFAITFNYANGTIKFYVDSVLVASELFDPFKFKIASNKNVLSLAIGTDSGKRDVLVNDLQQPGYYTFDGAIGDLKIFSTELDNWDIKAVQNYSKNKAYETLVWNMPVGSRNYVEEVERFFKHKMPGNKSQFFNIKLSGLSITDTTVREQIEDSIKGVLNRINPVHATLYQIIWE